MLTYIGERFIMSMQGSDGINHIERMLVPWSRSLRTSRTSAAAPVDPESLEYWRNELTKQVDRAGVILDNYRDRLAPTLRSDMPQPVEAEKDITAATDLARFVAYKADALRVINNQFEVLLSRVDV